MMRWWSVGRRSLRGRLLLRLPGVVGQSHTRADRQGSRLEASASYTCHVGAVTAARRVRHLQLDGQWPVSRVRALAPPASGADTKPKAMYHCPWLWRGASRGGEEGVRR